MNRRANTRVVAALLMGVLALACPSLVLAKSGGATPSGGTSLTSQGANGGSSSTSTPAATVRPGNTRVRASGDGITVVTRASAILRKPLQFLGNAGRRAAGDVVEIERRGRETGWAWAPTTHGVASSNGSFSATWPTNHIGRFSIRAVVEHPVSAHVASASPTLTITVYRPSIATIYGPGFWGSRTACGETLRHSTIGVANRTLKCGTKVALYYKGRTMVVPVIDRGPYAYGADWDLTEATAKALGATSTVTLGAVSLRR